MTVNPHDHSRSGPTSAPQDLAGESGKQRERTDVLGTYDGEVPSIEGGYIGDTQPFGKRGSIRGSEWQIAVLLNQRGHPSEVGRGQVHGAEVAGGEGRQEPASTRAPPSRASRKPTSATTVPGTSRGVLPGEDG